MTTTTTTTTITLTRHEVLSIATLANITPRGKANRQRPTGEPEVLTGIRLRLTGDHWSAVASDRYTAAEVFGWADREGEEDHTPIDIVIADEDWKTLAKAVRSTRQTHVTIEIDSEARALSALVQASGEDDLWHTFLRLEGNFPPLGRILQRDPDDTEPMKHLPVQADRVTRLAKVMSPTMMAMSESDRAECPMVFSMPRTGLSSIIVQRYTPGTDSLGLVTDLRAIIAVTEVRR